MPEPTQIQASQTPAAGQTAAGSPEGAAAPPSAPAGGPYTVKVDGHDHQVTLEELQRSYSLGTAANQRMQQAAEDRKKLDADVKVAEITRRVFEQGDMTALQELGRMFNVSDDALAPLMAGSTPPVPSSGGAEEYEPISMEDLDPTLQKFIKDQMAKEQASGQEKTRETIFKEALEGLDKDEILGKITDVGQRQWLQTQVKREVQRRIGLERQAWPDVLQDVLRELRATPGLVGNRTTPGNDNPFLGVGPAAAMGSSPTPTGEPPKPVSSTDADYKQNFSARLLQGLARLKGGS